MKEEGRDLTGVVVAEEGDLSPVVVESPGEVAEGPKA